MNSTQELAELRQVHASTLLLLAEVADFLARLPQVPVTRELAARIESHVADPRTAAINEATRLNDARLLHAGAYTAAGLSSLLLEIDGDEGSAEHRHPEVNSGTRQRRWKSC